MNSNCVDKTALIETQILDASRTEKFMILLLQSQGFPIRI